MSAPEKFRSAFNGFNRDDVVSYLEYINNRHNTVVNRLTAEADDLRARLEKSQETQSAPDAILTLEQEREELRAQLEALRSQKDALQERCDALEKALEEAQSSAPAELPAAYSAESELEMYRRAERTERLARERADVIYRQTSSILSEASLRVNDMADRVVPIADQILTQLTQLQETVHCAKQSLQDAASILNTLQANPK